MKKKVIARVFAPFSAPYRVKELRPNKNSQTKMSSSISFSSLSRRLYRSLLSTPNRHHLPRHFSTTNLLSDSDESPLPDSPPPTDSTDEQPQKRFYDRPLENDLDVGVYRAILVGKAGQKPLQKKLKNGMMVTQLSIGTGGIRNNRRPLDNENPSEYGNRCAIQWHRVSIYPQRLGTLAMKHVLPGSILYVEGNLVTNVFTDPITGLVRRVREVVIRSNGRIVFLSQSGDADQKTEQYELRYVGYF